MKNFEILPHIADLKLRIYANSKRELFINSLVAMFKSIRPIYIDNQELQFNISVKSIDTESLLVDFLNEALYISDVHHVAFKGAIITDFSDKIITATLIGSKIRSFELVEIKAVTYHDLKIADNNGIWSAEIVFDI